MGDLSPNSVGQKFAGIKNALENNYRENDIKWKPIKNKFPQKERLSGYKPYPNGFLQKMLSKAKTNRNTAVILFQNSVGGRIGIYSCPLLVKHTIMMSSTFDDNLDCMGVLLYADKNIDVEEMDMRDEQEDESSFTADTYWGFLTPETTTALLEYWDERKKDGEIFTPDTPIFRNTYRLALTTPKQLSRLSISNIFKRVLTAAKIPRVKKGRRYDIQRTHGNRKRFNTKLKLNKDVNSNVVEKLMSHAKGLDGVYLRSSRHELFKEFVIGIPDLTISDLSRNQIELTKERLEKDDLQKKLIEQRDTVREQVTGILNEKLDDMRKSG